MYFVVRSPYNFQCCGHFFRFLILLFLIGLPGIATAATGAAPSSTYKNTVERQYKQASDYYYKLRNNPSLAEKRDKWLVGIHELQRIYRIDPKSKRASSCLYTIARMYRTLYERFGMTADLDKAVSFYTDILTFFPKGNKADNALYALAQIEQEERGNLKQAVQYYDRLMRSYPTSSKKRLVKRQLEKLIKILEKNPDYQEKTAAPAVPTPPPVSSRVTSSAVPPVLQKPVVSKPQAESIKSTVKSTKLPPSVKPVEKVKKVVAASPVKNAVKNATSSVPQKTAQPLQEAQVSAPPPAKEDKAAPRTKIVLSALKKVESTQKERKEILAGKGQGDTKGTEKGTQQNTLTEQEAEPFDTTKKYLEKIPGTVDVLPVQYWSSDNYSRVVIKSSEPVDYHAKLLDQQNGVSRRLFIDFKKSYIPLKYRSPVSIEDGLLKRIHTSQLDATTVRVYLDTESVADYKVFNLKDPFRVVVDVRGGRGRAMRIPKRKVAPQIITDIKPLVVRAGKKEEAEVKIETAASEIASERVPEIKPEKIITPRKRKTVPGSAGTEKSPAVENLTLAQQLGLGVRRIVIDPGHGGKDPGAVGFGLQEKDIVLNVAKKIKKILEEKNGYEVLLTRDSDVSLSLEERTAIANTKEADLFLSIHVNAHPEETIRGVETFYLNLATHTEAMRVAALENATSTHNMSEMQDILSELMQNEKINESSQLAEFVQLKMISGLKKQKFRVKDLGVKQAPFYVLIGAEMPAILAEISFITNPEEAKLMKSEKYLQTLAEQMVAGVLSYVENQRTAALKIAPSPETSVQ
ncbi:N-acetylmuramoyl-L-alanine amidase [Candidatus Electrothrix marina]|uniref:N-acetylmuramoyl-L-alanine amidase n=1 Tax=Candidatus Electrothrix marina TaxID=1859130 RepID=A0A444JDP4_9BACT|nr:N-acetylmuramoyl-L-alanine amidase [Candidatus Electrothrix marina]